MKYIVRGILTHKEEGNVYYINHLCITDILDSAFINKKPICVIIINNDKVLLNVTGEPYIDLEDDDIYYFIDDINVDAVLKRFINKKICLSICEYAKDGV
jgi:hypothetical protein